MNVQKYLLDANFKVMRKGDFVEANESAGEIVYTSDNEADLAVGQLQEIATANKLAINKSLKKAEYVVALAEKLESLKCKEQNEMTESQKVEEIVEAGLAAGKSEDDILVEIINAGVAYKKAGKLFNQYMLNSGHRITRKERNEQVAELLDEAEFNPETGEEVAAMIEKITSEVKATNEKEALQAIRAFARDNDIELPKVPKKGRTQGGFKGKVFAWMLDNPTAGADDLTSFITEECGKNEATAKRFVEIQAFATKFAEAVNA